MAIKIGEEVKVNITVGDDVVTFIFPSYEEMAGAIKQLCTSRVRGRGMRQRVDVHGPREKFVNENLRDIMGAEYKTADGKYKALNNKVEGWLTKIPANWKYTAASFFEEGEAVSEQDLGNS